MALFPPEKPLPKIGPIRILCLAQLPEAKMLLRACSRLVDRAVDFRCDILCDPTERRYLERRITRRSLASRVRLSANPNVGEADVFVFASRADRHEGFPTLILKAMQAGVPVVSLCQSGCAELLVHEQTGFLVRPETPGALANALLQLARDPERRRQFAENARQRFLLHFDTEIPSRALRTLSRTDQPCPARQRTAYLLTGSPVPGPIREELAMLRDRNPSLVICAREMWDLEPTIALPKNPELNANSEWLKILRKALGDLGLQSEERECLWAIWLKTRLAGLGINHLHAVTSRDLLRAFLLSRIAPMSLSVGLEPGFVPNSLTLRLAGYCLGGRVSDRRQLAHLGPGFFLQPTPEEWDFQLRMWSIRSPLGMKLTHQLRARAFANALEPLPASSSKTYEFPRFWKSRRASLIEAPSMK